MGRNGGRAGLRGPFEGSSPRGPTGTGPGRRFARGGGRPVEDSNPSPPGLQGCGGGGRALRSPAMFLPVPTRLIATGAPKAFPVRSRVASWQGVRPFDAFQRRL